MSATPEFKQRLTISGYVRNIEQVYQLNIPIDINNIIYMFFKFCDKWNTEYSSDEMEIDESGLSLTVKEDSRHSAFGDTTVEDGIFSWRIQILASTTTKDEDDRQFGMVHLLELL